MSNLNRDTSKDSNIDEISSVGADIRALRKSRDVKLADMADQLGRSIGWLSQVERQQTQPSISDLREISKMFDIPISFFFRNELAEEEERDLIVRYERRATLGSRQDGLIEKFLSPHLSGDFEMIRSEFEPFAKSKLIKARPIQEGGYIIEGALNIVIGSKSFDLKTGDSFQFTNQNFRWANPHEEKAVALWVISPPIY